MTEHADHPLIVAVRTGDWLGTLRAEANLIAERLVETTSARDTAALAKRLTDLMAEIQFRASMEGVTLPELPDDPKDDRAVLSRHLAAVGKARMETARNAAHVLEGSRTIMQAYEDDNRAR